MTRTMVKRMIGSTLVALTILATAGKVAAQQADRQPGGRPMAGQRQQRDGTQAAERIREFIETLREDNAEEYARLMQLREDDPQQFRAELRELLRERVQERVHGARRMTPEDDRAMELARRYRQALTDAEKAAIREELRTAVEAAFDARLDTQQQMLERLQERLAELEEEIETRKQDREQIIQNRIDRLTTERGGRRR